MQAHEVLKPSAKDVLQGVSDAIDTLLGSLEPHAANGRCAIDHDLLDLIRIHNEEQCDNVMCNLLPKVLPAQLPEY